MLEIKRECFICKGSPDHFIPFSQYMRMGSRVLYRGIYVCEKHKDYYRDKILIYTPECVIVESVKMNNTQNTMPAMIKIKKPTKKEQEDLNLLKRAGLLEETKEKGTPISFGTMSLNGDSPIFYTQPTLEGIKISSGDCSNDSVITGPPSVVENIHKTISYGNSKVEIEATQDGKILSVYKTLDRTQVKDTKVISLDEIKVIKKEQRIKVDQEGVIKKTGG